MSESKKPERSHSRRLSLWIGVGLLAATGVVYGAARIYDHYTVHVVANGVTSEHQVEAGPDGTAMLQVPMEGGGQATILVGRDNVGADGQIHVSVESYQGNGGEFTGTATVQLDTDGKPLVKEQNKPAPKK